MAVDERAGERRTSASGEDEPREKVFDLVIRRSHRMPPILSDLQNAVQLLAVLYIWSVFRVVIIWTADMAAAVWQAEHSTSDCRERCWSRRGKRCTTGLHSRREVTSEVEGEMR